MSQNVLFCAVVFGNPSISRKTWGNPELSFFALLCPFLSFFVLFHFGHLVLAICQPLISGSSSLKCLKRRSPKPGHVRYACQRLEAPFESGRSCAGESTSASPVTANTGDTRFVTLAVYNLKFVTITSRCCSKPEETCLDKHKKRHCERKQRLPTPNKKNGRV